MNNYELVDFCIRKSQTKTKYKLGGIGRWEDGFQTFDCIGLVKSFLWDYENRHDLYNKTAPDWGSRKYFQEAKIKGPIADLPEIPGLILWKDGSPHSHTGVYIGNGECVEANATTGNVARRSINAQNWQYYYYLEYIDYLILERDKNEMNYNIGTWDKIKYHHFILSEKDELINASLPYKEMKRFSDWPDHGASYLIGGSNFFNNHSSDPEFGQIYGRYFNAWDHGFPEKDGYLDLSIDKNKNAYLGEFSSGEHSEDNIFASSYYAILVKDGKPVKETSAACGNMWSSINARCLYGMNYDHRFMITLCEKGLSLSKQRDLALQLRYLWCVAADGGGSAQLYDAKNKEYIYSPEKRKVPICLMIKEGEKKTMKYETNVLKVNSKSYILRKSIQGSAAASVNRNTCLPLLEITDERQADGFRWAKVLYNGAVLWLQYDDTKDSSGFPIYLELLSYNKDHSGDEYEVVTYPLYRKIEK